MTRSRRCAEFVEVSYRSQRPLCGVLHAGTAARQLRRYVSDFLPSSADAPAIPSSDVQLGEHLPDLASSHLGHGLRVSVTRVMDEPWKALCNRRSAMRIFDCYAAPAITTVVSERVIRISAIKGV